MDKSKEFIRLTIRAFILTIAVSIVCAAPTILFLEFRFGNKFPLVAPGIALAMLHYKIKMEHAIFGICTVLIALNVITIEQFEHLQPIYLLSFAHILQTVIAYYALAFLPSRIDLDRVDIFEFLLALLVIAAVPAIVSGLTYVYIASVSPWITKPFLHNMYNFFIAINIWGARSLTGGSVIYLVYRILQKKTDNLFHFYLVIPVLFLISYSMWFIVDINRTKTIGIIIPKMTTTYKRTTEAFVNKITETNKHIKIRDDSGDLDNNEQRIRNRIRSIIRDKVDVIYTMTTLATKIAQQETKNIPIIYNTVLLDREQGFIESFEKSGTNLVGVTNYIPMKDQIETLKRFIPNKKIKLAFVYQNKEPSANKNIDIWKKDAPGLDVEIIPVPVNDAQEIAKALRESYGRYNVIYSPCETMIQAGGDEEIIKFIKKDDKKIINLACQEDSIKKGATIGLVFDPEEQGLLATELAVDIILNGKNPKDMASKKIKRGLIVINLKAFKEKNITLSDEQQLTIDRRY